MIRKVADFSDKIMHQANNLEQSCDSIRSNFALEILWERAEHPVRTRLPDGREQELVRKFFGGLRSGFFVEVGANRPQQESQTWHLERLGWRGVLIEPQPDLAEELSRVRLAKVFAVACSSRRNAGKRMR